MDLRMDYLRHVECRHLRTKSKKYRTILKAAYLILYRIVPDKVEVLRAFHGSRSPKLIRKAKNIKV
jgi:toxin ParE1/3/4